MKIKTILKETNSFVKLGEIETQKLFFIFSFLDSYSSFMYFLHKIGVDK